MSSTIFEYYNNSPIITSILQFRYNELEEFDINEIKKISSEIEDRYPIAKEQFKQKFKINELETNVAWGNKEINGLQFHTKNIERKITIENTKFTFELFGKYHGWDEFIKDPKEVWALFNKYVHLEFLTGVSIRFINRINLPSDTKELANYFTTFINSNTGTHSISSFQMKYTTIDSKNKMHWNIGHALEKPIENELPYLFDIDVLINDEIPNLDKDIWNRFAIVREKKNFLFNDGITEKTKNLIR